MENCTISVTLPPSSDAFTKLNMLSIPAHVNVWVLAGAEELDFGVMTYATKPQRHFLLGTLSVAAGETVTSPSFRCLTASYLAIEIESAGPQHILNVTHVGYSPFGKLNLRANHSLLMCSNHRTVHSPIPDNLEVSMVFSIISWSRDL